RRVLFRSVWPTDFGIEAMMDGGQDAFIFRGLQNGAVSNDNILVLKPYASRVGINTISPARALDVTGDIRTSAEFLALGTGAQGIRWVDSNNAPMAHIHRFGA